MVNFVHSHSNHVRRDGPAERCCARPSANAPLPCEEKYEEIAVVTPPAICRPIFTPTTKGSKIETVWVARAVKRLLQALQGLYGHVGTTTSWTTPRRHMAKGFRVRSTAVRQERWKPFLMFRPERKEVIPPAPTPHQSLNEIPGTKTSIPFGEPRLKGCCATLSRCSNYTTCGKIFLWMLAARGGASADSLVWRGWRGFAYMKGENTSWKIAFMVPPVAIM